VVDDDLEMGRLIADVLQRWTFVTIMGDSLKLQKY
jgi:hypothetical protein